jgi:serine/threonine transporter
VFGTFFTGALKAVAPVLVFILITSSLASSGKIAKSRFFKVIVLYVATTVLAAIVSVIFSFIFKLTIPLAAKPDGYVPPSGLAEVFSTLLANIVSNPLTAIINGNYMGILTWAILFGIALKAIASDKTKIVIADISNAVSKIVGWVIPLAPIGVMGLVYSAVSELGMNIFVDYGYLILLLAGCMILTSVVINPLLVFLFLKKNPYPLLFRCLRESGLQAFFTRSSAANIPVNMKLCEKLGLDKEYYSVAIPLGATINMDGAAVTITVMALSAAFSQGISVNIVIAILLSFMATLGACGASGVAGGSLLLIPLACSLFGIPGDVAMQVVGVGFVVGVIQDSCETAINSSTDVLFTATAEMAAERKAAKAAK